MAREKTHDCNGTKMTVRQRKATKTPQTQKTNPITDARQALNKAKDCEEQYSIMFSHFKSVPENYQSQLEDFRAALCAKCNFAELSLSIGIGFELYSEFE